MANTDHVTDCVFAHATTPAGNINVNHPLSTEPTAMGSSGFLLVLGSSHPPSNGNMLVMSILSFEFTQKKKNLGVCPPMQRKVT
eukprot:CAMPEP_0116856312 /NCGR_PEP_ID=MMETSP0418-20121206/19836_1 /TAXON_ID=1158023 /ORGANISM="Astrosyne radiata, Strain 13vi08-1A" /LENGTH=83 /DNA_ID=CAMNT_0004489687 /DNA_START=43 /DNA_END=290 /DNA_ORIENTATION=+